MWYFNFVIVVSGRILRQQSSEELLEDIDKPEWSKAQLEDIERT